MFKKVKVLFFLLVMLSINKVAFAYAVPEYVRIGLEYRYKLVDTIPISNKSVNLGFETNSGFINETVLNSQSGFTMVRNVSVQTLSL